MTDELFLMTFCCRNSNYTHLPLTATSTEKTNSATARTEVLEN